MSIRECLYVTDGRTRRCLGRDKSYGHRNVKRWAMSSFRARAPGLESLRTFAAANSAAVESSIAREVLILGLFVQSSQVVREIFLGLSRL